MGKWSVSPWPVPGRLFQGSIARRQEDQVRVAEGIQYCQTNVASQGHEDEFPDCAMLRTRYSIRIEIHLPDLASRVDYLARPRRGPTYEYWRHIQEDQRRSKSRYQDSPNV